MHDKTLYYPDQLCQELRRVAIDIHFPLRYGGIWCGFAHADAASSHGITPMLNLATLRPCLFRSACSLLFAVIFFGSLVSTAAADLLDKLKAHTLPNSLTLLVYPRHDSPTFSAQILVNAGSSDEHLGITGVAHMFEHMAFKGSQTVGTSDFEAEKPLLERIDRLADALDRERFSRHPDEAKLAALQAEFEALKQEYSQYVKADEFSEIYQRNGESGLNASTGYDFTNYYVSLPSNRLELWMWLESDRLLHPVQREFYTERNVILEERNMRVENNPSGKLWETFMSMAFLAHPYGYPILGWPQDMARLNRAKAEEFRACYYVPANMIVVLVGDLDPDRVFAMAERYFGRLSPAAPDRPMPAAEPSQIGERRFEVRRDANPSLLIGYHKPVLPDRADNAADVTSQILSEGRTSRLYRSLVLEKQIATGVRTTTGPGDKYPNLFIISATPRAPHTGEEVEKAIYEEIQKLAEEGPNPQELQKVKNQLDADVLRTLRSNAGLANLLAYFTGLTGDPKYLERHVENLKSVTSEEVQDFIRTYLVAKNRTVGWIAPERDKAMAEPENGKM